MPTIYDWESKVFPGEANVFSYPTITGADLHIQKHLISPPLFCTKLRPSLQHRQAFIALRYDKEYADKWRAAPNNGFSIASVGNRLVEGGTVFWQIVPYSSGYRHSLSCSLLGFPPPNHSAGPLSCCPLSMGRADAKISDAGRPRRGNRCPLCLAAVGVLLWKHGKGQPPQRFYPSGQVTVRLSTRPEFS